MPHERDFADVPGACGNGELVPADRGAAHAIGPDIVLLAVDGQAPHAALEGQPGKIRHRERLQAKMIHVPGFCSSATSAIMIRL